MRANAQLKRDQRAKKKKRIPPKDQFTMMMEVILQPYFPNN
jgi:hypothetical protein